MSIINVTNLTFGYDGNYDNVFENVSFQLDTDWKLGFTGRNGRGKTTFLNLLLGKYQYSGSIHSSVEFEYFPYEVEDMHQTAIEIVNKISPLAEDWEIIRELSLLDVEPEVLYRPFETLSNGERTKIMLAALFLDSNKFLLIDEPTNHLDSDARQKVGEYLQKKKGFILVSHDRTLLDSCIDHILTINRTNIEIQQGNFSSWYRNKQMQDNFELAENAKLKKEINRLSESAKRSSSWSDEKEKSKFGKVSSGLKQDKGYVGHKAAKMMKRAKSQENRMLNAADKKSELLHNIEITDSLKLSQLDYPKRTLIYASGLSLSYDEYPVCFVNNLQVQKGDRIAVIGKNGCGKSTLLKLLCGENINYSGVLEIGSNLKISYVSQDTSFLRGSLSDYANICGIDESLFKSILRKMGFERVQFEKEMQDFSGGQKKKVLLARSLSEKAHIYIWDEPLNFIDVISRIQIEELLLEFKPTMIFVEHDIAFQRNIATGELRI